MNKSFLKIQHALVLMSALWPIRYFFESGLRIVFVFVLLAVCIGAALFGIRLHQDFMQKIEDRQSLYVHSKLQNPLAPSTQQRSKMLLNFMSLLLWPCYAFAISPIIHTFQVATYPLKGGGADMAVILLPFTGGFSFAVYTVALIVLIPLSYMGLERKAE